MTKNIGNLETWYNGFHFRSRAEARWAVFFDAAKIKYIHEPEAFTFNGMNYLPDFYLPDEDIYVEVKPPREGFEKEINKAITVMTGNKKILIVLMAVAFAAAVLLYLSDGLICLIGGADHLCVR